MKRVTTRKPSYLDELILTLSCLAAVLRELGSKYAAGSMPPTEVKGNDLPGIWRRSGWRAVREHFLVNCWPRTYRQKIQLKLGRPSLSIFRKYASLYERHLPQRINPEPSPVGHRVKILLIRNGAIGDVLMLTPVVKALHESRQGRAQIEVLTHCPEVFRNNPYIQQVHSTKTFTRAVHDYDLVINFNNLYENSPRVHPVDVYAHAALGHINFDKQLALYPSSKDLFDVAQQVRAIDGPFIVAHKPNHDWPNRNLPESFWSALLVQLLNKTGWTLVQVGSARDYAVSGHPRLLDLRGQHNLQQLAELIRQSRGFIGVDAGPSHIAACTDVPICTFYTCAHHEVRRPLRSQGKFVPLAADLDCYGCMQKQNWPSPGFNCARGDSICVRSFNLEVCIDLILGALTPSGAVDTALVTTPGV